MPAVIIELPPQLHAHTNQTYQPSICFCTQHAVSPLLASLLSVQCFCASESQHVSHSSSSCCCCCRAGVAAADIIVYMAASRTLVSCPDCFFPCFGWGKSPHPKHRKKRSGHETTRTPHSCCTQMGSHCFCCYRCCMAMVHISAVHMWVPMFT